MAATDTAGVHWSFWLISALALVFNLMGCVNFVSQLDPDTVAAMPEVYRNVVDSRPPWADVSFAVAVFGAALGAVLLLLRRRFAVHVLVVALVGAAVTQLPLIGLAHVPTGVLVGGLSQLLTTGLLIGYSVYAMRRRWIV